MSTSSTTVEVKFCGDSFWIIVQYDPIVFVYRLCMRNVPVDFMGSSGMGVVVELCVLLKDDMNFFRPFFYVDASVFSVRSVPLVK